MRDFKVQIPQTRLDDLQLRLDHTRWPPEVSGQRWQRGVPLDHLKDLSEYWSAKFDWRELEERINTFDQRLVTVDEVDIHVVHVPSRRSDAIPLMLLHGWPSSFLEFLDIAERLASPASDQDPAFHVVIPSIPGFGFSPHPGTPGWDTERVAHAFGRVMEQLEYTGYIVHGGDWGSPIALRIAEGFPEEVRGVHLSMLATFPPNGPESIAALSPADADKVAFALEFEQDASGWRKIQSTRPQTLAYALTDSPVGQLGWMVEKFHEWSSPGGDASECPISQQFQVATAALYWLTASAATSAQLYFESTRTDSAFAATWGGPWPIDPPVAVLELTDDVVRPVRDWGEQILPSLVSWRSLSGIGHFPALEDPAALATDLRLFAAQTSDPRTIAHN